MGSKFFSKARENNDDDLLEKQLSVLSGKNEKVNDEPRQVSEETNTITDKKNEPKTIPPAPISIEKKSIIQKDLVLTGTITAATSLGIYGVVNGNIDCKNNVTVSGAVKGNIKAESIEIMGGSITGDIECQSAVTIISDSEIHGNIKGQMISCDGKIEGNTSVTGKAEIKENAVILGDIDCGCISIREGAVCKGTIQTSDRKNKDEKSPVVNTADKKMNTDLKQYI